MVEKFEQLNINKDILRALEEMSFTKPTPIQSEVIPYILQGKDCMAQAPTGTGKTCAFGIPALDMINKNGKNVEVLVLCPTRELAMQIEAEIKRVAKYVYGAKFAMLCGGQPMARQLAQLRRGPQIVIGTPGRIMDHLRRNTLHIDNIKLLVLDEADEMLNMGFREDIDTILASASSIHQTVLFSATISREIAAISKSYQVDPQFIQTKHNEDTIPQIDQYYVRLKEMNKMDAFLELFKQEDFRLVLIFCNTKRKVDEVNKKLQDNNMLCEALHGDMRQSARDRVMRAYRKGDLNILVATDVAARGIDVNNIEAVFNYDLPNDEEYYIHRIGRTARASKTGISYSFTMDREFDKISKFEKITRKPIAEKVLEGISCASPVKNKAMAQKLTHTRFFVNVGKKDRLRDDEILGFIEKKAGVPKSAIAEIKVLEIFCFIEVENQYIENMLTLNGMLFGNRKLGVEVAGDKDGGSSSSRSSSRGGERSFNRGTEGRSFERKPRDGQRSFEGSRSGSAPRGRSFEGASSDRRPRSAGTGFGASSRDGDSGLSRKAKYDSNGNIIVVSQNTEGQRQERPAFGERKTYGERKPYGERTGTAATGERKTYGERKPYGEGGAAATGERKTYGERKPYGEGGAAATGERKTYGERKPYGERTGTAATGERKTYGERKSYGEGGAAATGERKTYGERKPYGERTGTAATGERKTYGAKSSFGKPAGSKFDKPPVKKTSNSENKSYTNNGGNEGQ